MLMAAANALAECSPKLKNPDASLLPALKDVAGIAKEIAFAVGQAAQREGLAPQCTDADLKAKIDSSYWLPQY
jgi:malate dehydrogenase (oxaloacetate-decarboxylating)